MSYVLLGLKLGASSMYEGLYSILGIELQGKNGAMSEKRQKTLSFSNGLGGRAQTPKLGRTADFAGQ